MGIFMTAWFFYASLWILRSAILANCEGKPKFRGKPRTQYTAILGNSVKLKCPVSGTDGPEDNRTLVAWFKQNRPIQNSNAKWRRFFVRKRRHLKIVNIKKKDAGIYTCHARNEYGAITLEINLKVKVVSKPGRGKPPVFKQFPKKRTTYQTGETAKLRCHSDGDPDPNVVWFKDGKPYGVGKRTSVGSDGWTLNLRYLAVENTGNYTCRVSNNVGSINRTFTVIVKARTQRPVIEEPEENRLTARQGRSVKFDCKATSNGELVFSWRWFPKNANSSVDLLTSSQFGTKYVENHTKIRVAGQTKFYFDGFLYVRDVRKQDEGRYTCVVNNSDGKTDKMNFYLRVKGQSESTLQKSMEPCVKKFCKKSLTTLKPPVAGLTTRGKVETTERAVPVMFVVVLTASIIVALLFIVVLIMCCRKQRKDLEKQYVSEYKPQDLFQPYTHQVNVYQEMQKPDQTSNKTWNGEYIEPVKASNDARASLQASQSSVETRNDSKRIKEPSSSSEMYLANSRTSLQTTLCRSCPRETSFDYKGSTNYSLPRTMPPASTSRGVLPRGLSFPRASTVDRDRRDWESETSLDNSPRNTSPQRSRESIV